MYWHIHFPIHRYFTLIQTRYTILKDYNFKFYQISSLDPQQINKYFSSILTFCVVKKKKIEFREFRKENSFIQLQFFTTWFYFGKYILGKKGIVVWKVQYL